MKKRLYVTGNINSMAKYLNMDEYKVLSLFDYDSRKKIKDIEKDRKEKLQNDKTTDKSKTIQASDKSI